MVRRTAVLALLCTFVALPVAAARAVDTPTLRASLDRHARKLGPAAGVFVRDLTTGRTLYTRKPDLPLAPASGEKLLTTATALLRMGPDATMETAIYGSAPVNGVIDGDVVLVGAGDPYLSAGQVEQMADALVAQGVVRIRGRVLADDARFDRRTSVRFPFSFDMELGGRLNALAVGQGAGRDPALHTARVLHDRLRHLHVELLGLPRMSTTPPGALVLASATSVSTAAMVARINVPSDNFAAEMLLKGLGAGANEGGTTIAGANVVRSTMAERFGIRPRIIDGSGLSPADRITARQVVKLLTGMAEDPTAAAFDASLPVAGRTGTLKRRMRGSAAQDRCRAKTGTLNTVSSLSGYCTTDAGTTIAFSIIENRVCTSCAKAIEDKMASVIARYSP